MENLLYYGDNLDVMKRHIKDESVDLVYLDPPFNSNANYNVLFAEKDGSKSEGQIQAFTDTWTWGQDDEVVYAEIVMAGGKVADCLKAFRTFLGPCDLLAYLVMMAPRLVELRRVMKPTASIYLHCDPSASHYLKLLMDAIFGPENFKSEVVWKRTSAHSSAKRFGPVHDIVFFYSKTDVYVWNSLCQPYDDSYIAQRFKRGGERPWKDADITGAGVRYGETGNVWRGFDVTAKGRHWAVPPAELDKLDADGKVYWPVNRGRSCTLDKGESRRSCTLFK